MGEASTDHPGESRRNSGRGDRLVNMMSGHSSGPVVGSGKRSRPVPDTARDPHHVVEMGCDLSGTIGVTYLSGSVATFVRARKT